MAKVMQDTVEQPLSPPGQAVHRFYAHARSEDRHHRHLVPGAASLHEAAIIFAEHWAAADAAPEVSVIVQDEDTGEQQCFMIDIDSGEAAPCT